jgi:hypothetical protein
MTKFREIKFTFALRFPWNEKITLRDHPTYNVYVACWHTDNILNILYNGLFYD